MCSFPEEIQKLVEPDVDPLDEKPRRGSPEARVLAATKLGIPRDWLDENGYITEDAQGVFVLYVKRAFGKP